MTDIYQTLANKIGGTRKAVPLTGDFPTVYKDINGWHIEMTGSPGDAGSSKTSVTAKYPFDDSFPMCVRSGDMKRFTPPVAKKGKLSQLPNLLRDGMVVWGDTGNLPKISALLQNTEVKPLIESAALDNASFQFIPDPETGKFMLTFQDQNHPLTSSTIERYVAAFSLIEQSLALLHPAGGPGTVTAA